MTTKTIAVWMLHKQHTGDSSAYVTLFSDELGLFSCYCKGARNPKKPGLLQAFTPLWVTLDERHQRFYAKTIESIAPSIPLFGNSLFSALYLNELLYYILKPLDKEPTLFAAYEMTLKQLTQKLAQKELEAVLRRFEWTLLQSCGYAFSWVFTANEERIVPEQHYRFYPGQGFIPAQQGLPGWHLLAIGQDDLVEREVLLSAKQVMRQAIDQVLDGRAIKARSLFK